MASWVRTGRAPCSLPRPLQQPREKRPRPLRAIPRQPSPRRRRRVMTSSVDGPRSADGLHGHLRLPFGQWSVRARVSRVGGYQRARSLCARTRDGRFGLQVRRHDRGVVDDILAGAPSAMTSPRSMAIIRSETDEISGRSCSMMSRLAPSSSRIPQQQRAERLGLALGDAASTARRAAARSARARARTRGRRSAGCRSTARERTCRGTRSSPMSR